MGICASEPVVMDSASTLGMFTAFDRTQKAVKAARKFEPQTGRKRILTSLRESDDEIEDDIDDPFHDNVVAVDESADAFQTDTSENDEEEVFEYIEPLQTLLDKLELHSSSVVRLHKMRRLPFLRRNLQRGFQLHCCKVGVDVKPQPLPRTSVSVIYSCLIPDSTSSHPEGSRTATAKSSMKDWLCPLCDLHKKFANSRMLDKHLTWDHPNVEMLWDQVRFAFPSHVSILCNVQHYTTLSLTIPDSKPES